MKISAADKTAVIKMPDSRLQLIKVNQWFWDEKAIVRRIGKNEIVIKSLLGPVPETFIFRKVGDKQTLQRYQTILPSQEGGVLFAPAPAQPIEK